VKTDSNALKELYLMKIPRVLIFSASFGAGHMRAADALIEAITGIYPQAHLLHLDCWAIVSKNFNSVVRDFYIGMLKHTPRLWGRFYYGTAQISPDSVIQRFLDTTGQNTYMEYIESFQPDLIICTYPTVAGVVAQLKMKGKVKVPLAVVITDYTVHNQWIHEGIDLYIVGSAYIYEDFISRGMSPDQVKATGIPVSPKFDMVMDKSQARLSLGLLPDRPTCLIMGGAYGVLSELKKLCSTLAMTYIPSQTIVVCGRDQRLYKSLDDVVTNPRNPIIRFGFVSNVEELMSAADIVITKAGGLTVSEALTKRLPIIIYKPIPGQEEENAAYLEKIGAGKTAHSHAEVEMILLALLKAPEQMQSMALAAASALPGHSAEKAMQYMFQMIPNLGIWSGRQPGQPGASN
jgi:processive 1,2-diacylglycerol beta-glucosyltransferase